MKVAFFDRDGTIIYDYPDNEWQGITQPVFLPHAKKAMKHVLNHGYEIIIITNQYLIGEEIITKKQYLDLTELMIKELRESGVDILDIFYCPHARDEKCNCRKPLTGLVNQALNRYPSIVLEESFIVGDSVCDIQLAQNLNMTSYGIRVKSDIPRSFIINDIEQLKLLIK